MKGEVYDCDACGVRKQEANNWFRVLISPSAVGIYRWHEVVDTAADSGIETKHICGIGCLSKVVSAHFSGARSNG